MGTLRGVVKKSELTAFSNPRAGGIIAIGVEEGDRVMAVRMTDGQGEIFIGTRDGMAIRFPESDVRAMGRAAYGVRGISLRDDDEVVAMEVVRPVAPSRVARPGRSDRHRKRLREAHGNRGIPRPVPRRVGIINIQTSERNGRVVGIALVYDDDELLLISQQGRSCGWRPRMSGLSAARRRASA